MTFSLTLLHPARKELDKLDNKSAKGILSEWRKSESHRNFMQINLNPD